MLIIPALIFFVNIDYFVFIFIFFINITVTTCGWIRIKSLHLQQPTHKKKKRCYWFGFCSTLNPKDKRLRLTTIYPDRIINKTQSINKVQTNHAHNLLHRMEKLARYSLDKNWGLSYTFRYGHSPLSEEGLRLSQAFLFYGTKSWVLRVHRNRPSSH